MTNQREKFKHFVLAALFLLSYIGAQNIGI
jgi:hypothetical protein